MLRDNRYEQLALGLAQGKTAVDAHEAAGFSRNRGNACVWARKPHVQERVKQLKAERAKKVVELMAVDRTRILKEIASLALAPLNDDNVKPSDKRAALMDYARIEGWVIDRKETGAPGEFSNMQSMEEVLAAIRKELGPHAAELMAGLIEQRGEGEDAPAATHDAPDGVN